MLRMLRIFGKKRNNKKVVLSQKKFQQQVFDLVSKKVDFFGKEMSCADFGGFGCLKSYFLAVKKTPWGNLTAIFS